MPEDAPHTNANAKDYDLRLFARLLIPSTLSAVFCLLATLFVVGGTAAITSFQGSSFRQDFLGFQQITAEEEEQKALQQQLSLSNDFTVVDENLDDNSLVRNIPVMAFWMFVGTLVYFVVTGIGGALASAKEIEDELAHYVHVRRKELLREVYIKTGIRFVALLLWLLFVQLFSKLLLPYSLAAAHIYGGDIFSWQTLPYGILAFIILALSLHLHIVMARLVVLRPRLFSQETSF